MSLVNTLKKHWIKITLFSIILLAFAIRLIYFEFATFGYDQARDAFVVHRIFIDDPIKIQGPASDIPGLFHGSLYWYLIAPFYFFSNGDPQGPRIFLILINLINISFIFFFSKKLFGKTSISLLSAFLFAVSFEAVQYSRWLSNPTPALLSIAVFYYGVWLSINRKPIGIGLALLGAAISMQFQIFLVYLSLFFTFTFIYYMRKNKIKSILTKENGKLVAIAGLFYLPFIVSELKFNFQAGKALFGFFSNSSGEIKNTKFVVSKLMRFSDSLILNISNNIIDYSKIVSTTFLVGLFGFVVFQMTSLKKEKRIFAFLIFWLLSPGLFYVFEKNNAYFLNIGNIYPLIILSAFTIDYIANKFSRKMGKLFTVFVLGVVTISNISLIFQNNKSGETLFSVQSNMNLAYEKEVIDWIYRESQGKPFVVNTVTNPLFVSTNWAYLLDWYGKGKYGYMPIWGGYPQVDVFGAEVQFSDQKLIPGLTHFLIIEPATGIPHEYILAYRVYEHSRGDFVTSKQFGEFNVEKRILKTDKGFQRDELLKYLPNQDTLIKPFNR